MTGLLIDTHVLLWWLADVQLRPETRQTIADGTARNVVSIASLWELAIKEGLGQLTPPEDPADAVLDEGMELLGITPAHTRAVRGLPLHHRDPFDRMLVAQAQVEGLTLVTRDRRLRQYDVALLEA